MKSALLIAYHYPPISGSSGMQRTLKVSKYLAEFGWSCRVLTVDPIAYTATTDGQMAEIPDDVIVHRVWALDTARHLSIRGSYPGFLARPDRWRSWWFSAVPAGLAVIRRMKPDVLWSTYPIATAHSIGHSLAKITGVPWVADFRDSMTEDNYPSDPVLRKVYQGIERSCVERARRVVFTTNGTRRMYRSRYPEIPDDRWYIIENGYDEENFECLSSTAREFSDGQRIVLVHSGILYPMERNPLPFFDALAQLRKEGAISADNFKVILRATGHDDTYAPILREQGIDDLVELAPSIPYGEALEEMCNADGLLLFQAANCNHQVPAKLYEYFRAQRPVLALSDDDGDTAATMRECGLTDIVDLDDTGSIREGLIRFLAAIRTNTAGVANLDKARSYSRRAQTEKLAQLFETIVDH